MSEKEKHVSFFLLLFVVVNCVHELSWYDFSLLFTQLLEIPLFLQSVFINIYFLLNNFFILYFQHILFKCQQKLVFKFHVFLEKLFYLVLDHLVLVKAIDLVKHVLIYFLL